MSKFRQLVAYEEPLGQGYSLLPFRFSRLSGSDYVLTNEAGQFLVLDRPTIEDFVQHRLDSTSPVYQDLKGSHFLIDADSSVAIDLLALKVRTKMRRLADFTALHIFVVSLRCEHSCPYCQVSRRTDDKVAFDMSWEVAQRSLELAFRSPSPAIKIEFQGGEPLLNFPLIERLVVEAKRLNEQANKYLAFVIATNLALLDENVVAFCRTHDIFLSTSLDGPRDLHNQNRPRPGGDSYERTISGIRAARAGLGRDRVSALMTSTNASLGRVRDIIDEYLRQGFDSIFLRPLSPYGCAIRTKSYRSYDTDQWLSFYFEGLDYIIELNKAGVPFVESYAATILTKMLSPFETGYVDLMSPAGIGIAAIIYNYNGDVYASDEGRMLAEMNDTTFRLGHVERNSFEEIFTSEQLLRPLEESFARSAPMCSECAFEPWCGADPVFHHATHGDFVGRKPESAFCHRNMAIFRRLISMMRGDESVRMLFHSWANQR